MSTSLETAHRHSKIIYIERDSNLYINMCLNVEMKERILQEKSENKPSSHWDN